MSNQVPLPPNEKSGEYKGPSHANNGIAVVIDGVKPVEVEGDEYHICNAVYQNTEVLSFEHKTNKQILQDIFQRSSCVFEQGKADSGDFIVCKLVVNDPKKRTIKGTAKQIIDTLQSEKNCKVSNNSAPSRAKDGGVVNSETEKKLFGGVIDGNTELHSTALSLQAIGLGPEQIFYETGYFTGLDGKWRSEIDDYDYSLNLSIIQLLIEYQRGTILTLGKLVTHNEFFRIFQKAKNISVNLLDIDKYDFTYTKRNPEENCIGEFVYSKNHPTSFNFYHLDLYIDFKYIQKHGKERKSYPSESSIELCILHEMQHIFQNQRGYRRGSSGSDRSEQVGAEIERTRIQIQAVSSLKATDNPNDQIDLEIYLNYLITNRQKLIDELYDKDPGEIEAKEAVYRFINKDKSFPKKLTIESDKKESGGFINSEKNDTKNIISGTSKTSTGTNIEPATNHIGTSESSGRVAKQSNIDKDQEKNNNFTIKQPKNEIRYIFSPSGQLISASDGKPKSDYIRESKNPISKIERKNIIEGIGTNESKYVVSGKTEGETGNSVSNFTGSENIWEAVHPEKIKSVAVNHEESKKNANDTPYLIRGIEGSNTSVKEQQNFKKQEGGDVSSDKIIASSSRFKPHETIVFEKPLIGPSGAQLLSYTWAFEWTMQPNYEGELVSKRISDWDQAISSADTGRDIVHQFTVKMPDGQTRTVSSESVLVLLGFTDRVKLKTFPSLVTGLKTLAKQKMKLAILEAQEKEYNELRKKFEAEQKPQVIEIEEPVEFVKKHHDLNTDTVFAMGNVWYRQSNDFDYNTRSYKKATTASRNTIEQLTHEWVKKRIEEAGGIQPRDIYDLRNRVNRQERKVKELQATTGIEINSDQKFESGGPFDEQLPQIINDDRGQAYSTNQIKIVKNIPYYAGMPIKKLVERKYFTMFGSGLNYYDVVSGKENAFFIGTIALSQADYVKVKTYIDRIHY